MNKMPRQQPGSSREFVSTRRELVGAASALGATAFASGQSWAASPSVASPIADARKFGAKGDGSADDAPSIQAALASAQIVELPPGIYRVDSPVVLKSGQILRGAGRSGWEPYAGDGAPPSPPRTVLLIDGCGGIDARGANNAGVYGLAIQARQARQSAWARRPGAQRGATGIHISGTLHFEATDISFHGLEVAVAAEGGSRTAQMPHIGNWSAHDCETIFKFVSSNPDLPAVRDARIEGCIGTVHCGLIAQVSHCDGLRIEGSRFFQCSDHALSIADTPFVSISGTTFFETGREAIVLRGCTGVTISGCQIVRSGYYQPPPAKQQTAIVMERCADVTFEGLVERPVGRAFLVRDCSNVSINAAIATPFWTTGSLGSNDAAVWIEKSTAVAVNATFGGTDYWIAVFADSASAPYVTGRIATEGSAGVIRCTGILPAPFAHVLRTPSLAVPAGESAECHMLRILVPAGKRLVSRSVELTADDVLVASGPVHWAKTQTETGGGTLSLERKTLHRNDSNSARYAAIAIGLYNPGKEPQHLDGGHEIRLSFAFERLDG